MPFDNPQVLVKADDTDELLVLGITPVPIDIVQAHKRQMTRKYGHRPFARWQEVNVPSDLLMQALTQPQLLVPHLPVAAAPKSVIAVAETVRQTVPDARFALGYFYADPYLVVRYGQRRAYLGVWLSKRRLVAIARRDSDPSQAMIRLRTRFTG